MDTMQSVWDDPSLNLLAIQLIYNKLWSFLEHKLQLLLLQLLDDLILSQRCFIPPPPPPLPVSP